MKPKFLNRYTTLPILLDMLWRKQITLLSPQTWEDRNDAYYLERYQVEKDLDAVLALCFSTASETFHHWRVFSNGPSGVCIGFDAEQFLVSVRGKSHFRVDAVKYSRIDDLERTPPPLMRWPFLKRLPFRDEAEFRVIYEGANGKEQSMQLDFDIESIKRVTLSPWMPKAVSESVISLIETIPDCSGIYVNRSTLVENGRWKKVINSQKGR